MFLTPSLHGVWLFFLKRFEVLHDFHRSQLAQKVCMQDESKLAAGPGRTGRVSLFFRYTFRNPRAKTRFWPIQGLLALGKISGSLVELNFQIVSYGR